MNNTQQSSDNCRQLLTDSFDIDLANACEGYYLIQTCPPLYFSVEGVVSQSTSNSFICNEPNCRYPDSTKFVIDIENLGCYSCATKIVSQVVIFVFGILVLIL